MCGRAVLSFLIFIARRQAVSVDVTGSCVLAEQSVEAEKTMVVNVVFLSLKNVVELIRTFCKISISLRLQLYSAAKCVVDAEIKAYLCCFVGRKKTARYVCSAAATYAVALYIVAETRPERKAIDVTFQLQACVTGVNVRFERPVLVLLRLSVHAEPHEFVSHHVESCHTVVIRIVVNDVVVARSIAKSAA